MSLTWRLLLASRALVSFAVDSDCLPGSERLDESNVALQLPETACGFVKPKFFNESLCGIFVSPEACEVARRQPIWLASFPGSGNTWMRKVLEEVSRIHSGSVYHDATLSRLGFVEGVADPSEVLGIKTHFPVFPWKPGTEPRGGKVVWILREPLHAALSWTAMRLEKEVKATYPHGAQPTHEQLRQRFDETREESLRLWANHTRYFAKRIADVLPVRFEKLMKDTEGVYQTKLLPFLGLDISSYEARRRLHCAITTEAQDSAIHREHSYSFDFSTEDHKALRDAVGEPLLKRFGYSSSLL